MTVDEAQRVITAAIAKYTTGGRTLIAGVPQCLVGLDALQSLLTAYDAQQTVVNVAFEWRDSLIDRPIPKTGAARNLRLALRDYAARTCSCAECQRPPV